MRTVSGADKVIVLSDGAVAEQGKPAELMNTGSIYPHMVKLQRNAQFKEECPEDLWNEAKELIISFM